MNELASNSSRLARVYFHARLSLLWLANESWEPSLLLDNNHKIQVVIATAAAAGGQHNNYLFKEKLILDLIHIQIISLSLRHKNLHKFILKSQFFYAFRFVKGESCRFFTSLLLLLLVTLIKSILSYFFVV